MRITDLLVSLAALCIGFFGAVITAGALAGWSENTSRLGHVALTIVFGLIPLAIAAGLLVWVRRRFQRRQRETLERRILALCDRHEGRLTPAIVARSTELTLAESKAVLDRLHVDGHCSVELADDGTLTYRFG